MTFANYDFTVGLLFGLCVYYLSDILLSFVCFPIVDKIKSRKKSKDVKPE